MSKLTPTASDFVSNATTASKENVTGAVVPGSALRRIYFDMKGVCTVAATTTGVGVGVDVPAGATLEAVGEVMSGTSGGTDLTRQDLLTADDTFNIPTDMAGTTSIWRVWGWVSLSTTAGDIQIRVDTDAAASVTMKKGIQREYVDCGLA